MLQIELVYSRDDKSLVQMHLELPEGSTVADALERSGIHTQYPETALYSLGIFSRSVTLESILQQGDRLEIYRPLRLNPMDKRRQLAKKMK